MPLDTGATPLSVFLLGGCDIHGPTDPLMRAAEEIRRAPYGHVPFTYTFGEMFQAIEVLRGEREVPPEIRPLCFMDSEFCPVARAADFSDVDVFLVEPASSINLMFRGYYLNRNPLSKIVLEPLRKIGKEAAKYANQWLRAGLVGQDANKRLELAQALIAIMPKDLDDGDLIRSILQESHSEKIEVLPTFAKLQRILGRPTGVVNYVFRYLPDGRAVSWPAGHQEEILAAANALDIPVFDPAPLVRKFGVQAALLPELSHYSDDFNPVLGSALADFVRTAFRKACDGLRMPPAAEAPRDEHVTII